MMEFRELFEFSFPDLNPFGQSRLMTNSQLEDVIPVNLNLKLYVFNDEQFNNTCNSYTNYSQKVMIGYWRG
jgi:hypothetical protein